MNILSFAGWAQNPASLQFALQSIFPPPPLNKSSPHKIINFDYSRFSNIKDCFKALNNLKIKPDIIIGWSLGGQIACRLIAQGVFKPDLLILLATPFQFVKTPKIAAAMPQNSFEQFRDNFVKNSTQTLGKFSLLMMLGSDKRAKELADNLHINDDNYRNLIFWLDELEKFSCFDLNFNNFSKTLIFHGAGDMVVNPRQAEIFHQKITNSILKILPNCGHCPHISNLEDLKNIINYEFDLKNEQ